MTQPKKVLTPEGEEVERARQIIRALDRTLRSHRLYSEKNPVLQKHQQELLNLLSQYFSDHDDLQFDVTPFELRVGEHVVYNNENQQESFAFRLFNDGIRALRFLQGLPPEEMAGFLAALNAGFSGSGKDSDAVTLFWEKEFEHIEYTVADSIVDEPLLDDKSTDEKIEEIIDPSMSHYQGPGGDPYDEEVYKDFNPTLNVTSVGQLFQHRAVLTAKELTEIQTDLAECDQPERLVLDFVDMVLAVMQEETVPEDYVRATEALGQVLDANLMQGHLHIARLIMEEVHRFPARPIELARSDPALLPKTLKFLWTQKRVDLLLQSLNQDPKGTPEDIEVLIRAMDPNALPHLLKHIVTIVDVNRRRLVCSGIAHLHKGDVGIFVPLLGSKDLETIRAGLFIISALRHDKIIDMVAPLISHPDLSIRKEAVSVFRNFPQTKAFRILLNLLTDSNAEIRLLALRILSSAKDRDVGRHLISTIHREDFQQKSLVERKAYYHAAARIVGDDLIPFLKGILDTRSWFRKEETEELYQCAIYALGVVGTPTAKQTLQELSQSKNKTIRRLSETALRLLAEPKP